ncbi:MAG: acyl-CoA ligase (AMP-forming), exosortase A system-associated [Pseudomonadota bacterium]
MDYLVHHLVRSSAVKQPDKEALVSGQTRLSYAQVHEKISTFGSNLASLGIERGDRVGVFLQPSIEQAVSFFGISQAGGVFVPIHHSLMATQLSHILRDCEIRALITNPAGFEALGSIADDCPSLSEVILVGERPKGHGNLVMSDFAELCTRQSGQAVRDISVSKDLAAILYTSGSTGLPKGVMLSHENIIAGAAIVSEYLNISESDRTFAALPFSFDAGLNQLMTAMQNCATCVIQNWLFANQVVKALTEENITGLAGVPSLWSLIAQPSAGLGREKAPHLRYITNTGGEMPQNVLGQLQNALPDIDIVLMYGLTEAFRSTYLPADQLKQRPTSMGKAIPNTEILVVDSEGKRCKAGEVGELVHHGPTVSMGYWDQAEKTAELIRPHPDPPKGATVVPLVCYSGDLVKRDEEGYLYFVGRRDNLIKSSGFRISPTEVEQVLSNIDNVQQAAVVGRPHDVLGQTVVAYVVSRENIELNTDEILAVCAERLPRHMVPRDIEVIDILPRTATGKVDYPSLKKRCAAD